MIYFALPNIFFDQPFFINEQSSDVSVLTLSIFYFMSSVIRVSHISRQFKNTRAMDDLSFTVNEGDVYGFSSTE